MAIFSKPPLLSSSTQKPLFIVFAIVLLLRSRLLSLPKRTIAKLSNVTFTERLSPQELAHVLQQVYVTGEKGSKILLVPYRDRVSKVCRVPMPESGYHLTRLLPRFQSNPPRPPSLPRMHPSFLHYLPTLNPNLILTPLFFASSALSFSALLSPMSAQRRHSQSSSILSFWS